MFKTTKYISVLTLLLGLCMISTHSSVAQTPATPGVCYASTGYYDGGRLYTVNTATGVATLIGDITGYDQVAGLAINSQGDMFATDNATRDLIQIDAATGAPTLVGTITTADYIEGIAFNASDVLYGVSWYGGDLVTINTTTAALTVVGNTGVLNLTGLAFDPTSGILYGSRGYGLDSIYTINTTTGAATLLGSTGLGGSTPDLMFDAAGTLYGSKGGGGTGSGDLITIDKTTGAGTVVGSFGVPAVSGLACYNPPQTVCPQTQGYWKNNASEWPVTSLMLGTVSYTQSHLLEILNMPVKGDASLILANQLIAAKLNVASGASAPAPIPTTISAADAAIGSSLIPMKVKSKSPLGMTMTTLGSTLEEYNSGVLNTGCTTPAKIAQGSDGMTSNTVPEDFALDQNYPNPFNPTTTIHYTLPADAHVALEVYDVLGRRVAGLVDGQVTAGYHDVTFDASTLASGIYFYRLNADDGSGKPYTQIRKLVLMK